MANNCDNYVMFTGEQKDLQTIYDRFNRYREFDYFTNFSEMVLGLPISEGNFDGYKYGTKWWEFSILELGEGYLNIQGDTAWSPPLMLISEITRVFNVKAEGNYYEGGMDFAGEYTAENGNLEDNEFTCFEYDLKEDRDYAIQRLIEDLQDGTIEEYDELKHLLTKKEIDEINSCIR